MRTDQCHDLGFDYMRISSHRRVTTPKPRIPERRYHGKGYEVGGKDSLFSHLTIQRLQKYIIFNLLLFSVSRPLQQALDSIMLFEDLLSVLLSLFRNSWVYRVMPVSYTYRQHLEWKKHTLQSSLVTSENVALVFAGHVDLA